MIEQLNNYLNENTCDYERESKQEILLDDDRIQIYFRVDEDYCVYVYHCELYDEDGNEVEFSSYEKDDLMWNVATLLNEWVKPSDNTVVIEGRSYEI